MRRREAQRPVERLTISGSLQIRSRNSPLLMPTEERLHAGPRVATPTAVAICGYIEDVSHIAAGVVRTTPGDEGTFGACQREVCTAFADADAEVAEARERNPGLCCLSS